MNRRLFKPALAHLHQPAVGLPTFRSCSRHLPPRFRHRGPEAVQGLYGGTLGCAEGRSADTWVDFDFFGHQLTIQQVARVKRPERTWNPDGMVPSEHFGIVLEWEDWHRMRDKLQKVGCPSWWTAHRDARSGRRTGEPVHRRYDGRAIEFKAFERRRTCSGGPDRTTDRCGAR